MDAWPPELGIDRWSRLKCVQDIADGLDKLVDLWPTTADKLLVRRFHAQLLAGSVPSRNVQVRDVAEILREAMARAAASSAGDDLGELRDDCELLARFVERNVQEYASAMADDASLGDRMAGFSPGAADVTAWAIVVGNQHNYRGLREAAGHDGGIDAR